MLGLNAIVISVEPKYHFLEETSNTESSMLSRNTDLELFKVAQFEHKKTKSFPIPVKSNSLLKCSSPL